MDDQPIKFEIPLFGGTGTGAPTPGTPAAAGPAGTGTPAAPATTGNLAPTPGHPFGAVHPMPAPGPGGAAGGAPNPAQPLTPAELQEVRTLLSLLGPGWMHRLAASAAAAGTPAAGGPATPAGSGPAAAPDLGWLPEPGPSSEPAAPL
ncbi:MAG: hypothetical protein GX442_00735, partial [Candidatus Riflebacteria bacterium]|nr:hypothetical protein [Candidatus Riflebacteria bacterium]